MSKEEQLLLASNIEKHYACRIIKNDNAPFTLFCSADIGKILGMTNISKRLSPNKFNYDDRILVNSPTNGGEQNMLYLTYNGLLKLLSTTRKTELIDFSEKVGIDIKNRIYSCIEADTIKCLLKSFSGEEMIEQYVVGDNQYRIDLYFPQYKIAIECDENHHKTITNKLKDLERQSAIKDIIEDCIFVRYDPFCENFNIFNLINEIFIEIMKCKTLLYKINSLELEKEKTKGLIVEVQLEELKLEELKIQVQQMKMQKNPIPENVILETTAIAPTEEPSYVKLRENGRSPKVYQYDPITLEFIQMYDSIITFTRHFNSSSGSAVREAYRNNRTYKGFRWMLADRNITEIPVPPPTVETRTQSIEFIAMIDIKKTKIMEVYASQKDAAMSRNLAGFSTISRAIKEDRVSSGHYWNFFDKCSQEMRDEYLSTRTLPEPYIKVNGTSVIQINQATNEHIKTYKSITEVLKKFQMSRGSLTRASENNEIHNGFKWQIVQAP
uniref:Restriction endonuclease PvuRts1 I-like N-terminal domain-containing protein n=1 Tax=viral metagenome TaxID=1070528 RepID=A0A6C0IG14_9ZZZZ